MREEKNTRILIEGNDSIKKLCNILTLKEGDRLYEYKITFPKAPGSGWNLQKDIHFSSVEGVLKKPKEEFEFGNNIEISYHFDGRISYKNICERGKHYHKKTKPFNKIKKYTRFLRFSTSNINLLCDFKKKLNKIDKPQNIKKLLNKQFTIDFYLMKNPINFECSSKFKNNYQFLYEDEENGYYLLLHFYQINNLEKGVYFQITPDTTIHRARNKIFYYKYKFLNRN